MGTKAANGLNLYDMSGNVFEWCWDWDSSGELIRVFCGGSWTTYDGLCKVSNHASGEPPARHDFLGLRLVRSAN